jgi:hypothetical protein
MARTAVIAGTATAVVGAVGGSKQKSAAAQQQATAAQQQDAMQQQQLAEMQAQLDQMEAEKQAVAQQEAIDRAVAEKLAAQTAVAVGVVPAAAAVDDPMAQLQKLADMKAQGLLTDEEFSAMKAKVLGGVTA